MLEVNEQMRRLCEVIIIYFYAYTIMIVFTKRLLIYEDKKTTTQNQKKNNTTHSLKPSLKILMQITDHFYFDKHGGMLSVMVSCLRKWNWQPDFKSCLLFTLH